MRVADIGVVFEDDRVERDLRIFAYPVVPQLTLGEQLLAKEILLKRAPDQFRRRAPSVRGLRFYTSAQVPREPDSELARDV